MGTLKIVANIIQDNIWYFLPVGGFIILTSVIGVILLIYLIDEDRWQFLLPAGVIFGIFSFIFMLGTLGHFFKGPTGIAIILTLYALAGFAVFQKIKSKIPKVHFKLNFSSLIVVSGGLFFGALMFLLAGNTVIGGDVAAYWGFSTSFGNGNYPQRSPWQPDLLTVHHQGAFLYEGAIFALTNVDMRLIHTLFAFTVMAAGFYLLWAWVYKQTGYTLFSILPAIVAYFPFGGIFLLLPAWIRPFLDPEVEHPLTKFATLTDFKNRLGGASDINSWVYINYRAAALACFLLILMLAVGKWKISRWYKPVILAAISVPVLSADEVFLPPLGAAIALWALFELYRSRKTEFKKTFWSFLAAGLVFVGLFFIIGNPLRDSIFTPSYEKPRFQIIVDSAAILQRAAGFKSAVLKIENREWLLFLPHLGWFVLFGLILASLIKDKWGFLVFFSGIGIMIGYFFAEHTYWPGNQGRFLHLLYILYGTLISYCLVLLSTKFSNRLAKYLALVLTILLFLPAMISSLSDSVIKAKTADYPNFQGKMPQYTVLRWARKNIPQKRIFFIDGFLHDYPHSFLTLHAIQNYGLFVPISPASIKVHTPDWGIEAVDIIGTLNPSSLKELKIEYLYLANNQRKYYDQNRLRDLENRNFFTVAEVDEIGVLYKVGSGYIEKGEDHPESIASLAKLIPKGSKIFLEKPPGLNFYIRGAAMLAVKNGNEVYGALYSGFFNYIETEIKILTPDEKTEYDYLILGPETDPYTVCNCSRANAFWAGNGIKVWKVI